MEAPARIGKARSLRYVLGFTVDPLLQTRRLHEQHGAFVQLATPASTTRRPRWITAIADSELYREILADPAHWRNVKITFNGIRDNAARRMSYSMTRLRGERHEHYRRLITPALARRAVEAMSGDMQRIAERQIAAWPADRPLDLLPLTRGLAQAISSSLLFGADLARAAPVSRLIAELIEASWFLPSLAYLRRAAHAPRLERLILQWADEKRGEADPRDLLSILVNNPDETGRAPDATIICGLTGFLFGASYDTCQNGLAWALILLTQYPETVDALAAEIGTVSSGGAFDVAALDSLPLLDGVIRESMRLFPPVPFTSRKALAPTRLGGVAIDRDSRVLVSAHVINRDPRVYVDPHCFRPERWRGIAPSPFQYPVFGAGRHMCPGVTFGVRMLKVALAGILSRYRLELAAESRIEYRTTITLSPKGRIRLLLRDRARPVPLRRARGVVDRLIVLPPAA